MRCSLTWCRKTQVYFYVLFPFYHQLRFSCFNGRDNLKRTQGLLQIDTSVIFNSWMSGPAYKTLSNMMWRLISLVNLTGCRLAQETGVPQREHPPRVSQFKWEDPLQVLGSWTALKETELSARSASQVQTQCDQLPGAVMTSPNDELPLQQYSNPFLPTLPGFLVVATRRRTNTQP